MRSAFDFAPYRRSTIGFDRLFDLLENSGLGQGSETYPPFDLIQVDNNHYRINLAVAGFTREEIDITAQQNQLIVAGKKADDDKVDYIHRGIANRQFERRFGLADFIKVTDADLKDGLLSIDLVREIPEAMRPRKVSIGGLQNDRPTIDDNKERTIEATAQESEDA
jgi:molecular chaperone IbpA